MHHGRPRLERAVSLCQDADLPGYFPLIAASLCKAYTLSGCVANALSLLTQALEQAVATDTFGFQVFCGLSLGETQRLAGRLREARMLTEQARAELSIAIELYRTMDMAFWLPQAKSALAEVEGR